jgi:putative DNA primase/helicase
MENKIKRVVNFYNRVTDKTPAAQTDILSIYEYIRTNPELKAATEEIQTRFQSGISTGFSESDKKEYQAAKTGTLPCVMFSGCFDRAVSGDEQPNVLHSGRMNVDIDLDAPAMLDAFFNAISDGAIPFIEAAARSVSGIYNGAMWVNVLIEIPDSFSGVSEDLAKALRLEESSYRSKMHTAYFDMFASMLKTDAEIKAGSTKDIKRMRYLSFDPEIYVNTNACQITQSMLLAHKKHAQKKHTELRAEMSAEFMGMQSDSTGASDPYKIALKYAENRAGACVTGNQHNFMVYFATCLNRMGITEMECMEYATGKMGLSIGSNCISFPYRAYSADFGVWQDWKGKPAPTANEKPETRKGKAKTEETEDKIAVYAEIPEPGERVGGNGFFMPLGFNKDETGVQRLYFYGFSANCIIYITPAKISEKTLLMLAPLWWWTTRPGYATKRGLDTVKIADDLIHDCTEKGFFSPLKIRGRGAWMDSGRVVIHTGNELIIDGQRHKLGTVETEFIYEIGAKIDISMDNPMEKEEASRHAEILGKLNWSRGDFDAMLLTGWLALVPIAGALKWRPHIWITGGAGSGKTWVNKNVVNRLTGDFAYKLEGGSSEAGIRQLISTDAMSIVFDEAEGENDKEKANIENILHLVRSSSSSDNMIVKFNQMTTPRSMFAFFSIVPQTVHNADKRRVTILRLGKGRNSAEFSKIEDEYMNLVGGDYVKRFQARMITLMPAILQSIDVMVSAIARKTGKRDLADQVGAMLAGWWHSCEDAPMTMENAEGLIEELDFSNEQAMEVMPEEERCLQHLLSSQLKANDFVLTVGELLDIVNRMDTNAEIGYSQAHALLKRNGIMLDDDYLYIATADSILFLRQTFRGTNWATDHRHVLERIDGAFYKKQQYFCTGLRPPAVAVPVAAVWGDK